MPGQDWIATDYTSKEWDVKTNRPRKIGNWYHQPLERSKYRDNYDAIFGTKQTGDVKDDDTDIIYVLSGCKRPNQEY